MRIVNIANSTTNSTSSVYPILAHGADAHTYRLTACYLPPCDPTQISHS